ncbi:tetratricopeptide repeat protein [bacterium]|nr:tetratricopeptide repeat protein [bacterium]
MKKCYRTVVFLVFLVMLNLGGCAKDPKRIENSEIKYNIAKKFFFRGRVPEAIVNLEESLKENPKNSDAHNFYGLILFQSKRYEKAEKHFQKAVKINDKFADAHNNLCALYIDVNRFSKAQEHCKKAVSNLLYATPERAYYNLGRSYEKMAKDEIAIEYYEKAINSNPRFVLALDKLGAVHFKQQNYKKAEGYYKSASKACKATKEDSWGEVCGYSFLKLSQIYSIFKDYKSRKQALSQCLKYANKGGQAHDACQKEIIRR